MRFLHRMHQPETYPVQATELAPHILETWLIYAPASAPAERDFEDWAENAVMLHQAHIASDGKVEIVASRTGIRFSGDLTSYIPAKPECPDAFMFGMFKASDTIEFPFDVNLVANNADIVTAVMACPQSPVFQKAANRTFHVVDADYDKIEAILLEMHLAGHREVFLKTRFKHAAMRFTLPENTKNIWHSITRDSPFEWFLVEHEGNKDALYIQSAFEPRDEYRMIIVGDRPATGAGCIERFTPIDNRGAIFDTRVESIRNLSETRSDPALIDRYLAFAQEFALAWAEKHGSHMVYSLDLAIDAQTEQVVAIEMNPFMNLGLYACNASGIIAAIVRRYAAYGDNYVQAC